jgi:hypothetical protein
MENKAKIFVACIVGALVIVIGLGTTLNKPKVNKLDGFAQCIKDSGAKYYGAFWCPHCQKQGALFGSAKRFLPYIECSNPDRTQTQVCIDAKIDSYPTWILADGTRLAVENDAGVTLETLAQKTQCALPQ